MKSPLKVKWEVTKEHKLLSKDECTFWFTSEVFDIHTLTFQVPPKLAGQQPGINLSTLFLVKDENNKFIWKPFTDVQYVGGIYDN